MREGGEREREGRGRRGERESEGGERGREERAFTTHISHLQEIFDVHSLWEDEDEGGGERGRAREGRESFYHTHLTFSGDL